MKVNFSTKDGKTHKRELDADNAKHLRGKKIGDKFKGELLDLTGYELQITGGSDASGFPMRSDVNGVARKRVLITGGVGLRKSPRKGLRLRKTVVGNTIEIGRAHV